MSLSRTLLLATALCAMAVVDAKLLYAPRTVPKTWKLDESPVDATSSMPITIGLHRRNLDKMNAAFWAASDPKAETYGNHITNHEEMRRMVGATDAQIKTVRDWLAAHHKSSPVEVVPHHDYVTLRATVAELESLLSVKFHNYKHTESGRVMARAVGAVHIPAQVEGIVETISGFGGFPAVQRPARVRKVSEIASPQTNVTPALLYQAYNETSFPPTPAGQRNIQAFFQAQGQWVLQSDLSTFCQTFLNVPNCSIARYIGDNQPTAGVESSLDSEFILSTGHLTETWVYTFNSFDFCGDLMRWAAAVFAESDGSYPWVISMSYGSQALPNYCLGPDVKRLNEDTQKMGLMGITVVIASGDDGSGESDRQTGFNFGYLAPSFPASMQYVTSVGSTTFVAGNSGTQTASNAFGSGGGFSVDYDQPSYQQAAVSHYFKTQTQLPPWITYNNSGRATPDVSVLGEGFYIISEGQWFQVDGTSCSTPSFAGMVTMLNNVRLQAGKTLGFINPFLYGTPSGFTDILTGSNDVQQDGYGWYATSGWDPATGLGTPNFGRLADAVRKLNSRNTKAQPHGGSIKDVAGKMH
jgi:tripeptidyl-peptidase-1